jgi:hypothetical protein
VNELRRWTVLTNLFYPRRGKQVEEAWAAGAMIVAWDDARSNVFEEDGDIWIGHDPPTNGLADAYNVRPYPPQFSPGDSYRCWMQRYNWRASWRWSDGRVVPRRVQNEMAGYRDAAVVEVR